MNPDDRPTSMNVSLPTSLRSYVEARVTDAGYTSSSEYVRELIRRDREHRAAQERLEGVLLEGLHSGPAGEWTEDDWATIRRRVADRIQAEKRSG